MEGEGEQLPTKVVDRGEWVRVSVAMAAEGSGWKGDSVHSTVRPCQVEIFSHQFFPLRENNERDKIIKKSLFVCLLLPRVTPGLDVKTQVPGLPVTSLRTFRSVFSLCSLSFLIC